MKSIFVAAITAVLPAVCAESLTLAQAEEIAVRNHPRIQAARADADAAQASADILAAQQRLQLSSGFTGSIAEHGTRLGIGGVNAPDLFSRVGVGFSFSQLLTDFGRTGLARDSARDIAQSRIASATATASEVRLQARTTFFRALQSQYASAAAAEVRRSREVLLRQVKTLAESDLRSTLDVAFAEVRMSEAELLVTRTDNDRLAALILLARALGLDGPQDWKLEDPAMTDPDLTLEQAIAAAVRGRPEVVALTHEIAAARKQLESDNRLRLPSVELVGLGGFLPVGDPRLRSRYAGAAINLNLPVLNGSAFSARQRQSRARLATIEARHRELVLQVTAAVRNAYLTLSTARKAVDLSRRLQEQADRTLRLSETRYTAGLGTIAEYTQAQLDAASAQIAYAVARYEAGVQISQLEFELGRLQ